MRVRAALTGDLAQFMRDEVAATRSAVQGAVIESGRGLKEELRRRTNAIGLRNARRLANTWRDKAYPNDGLNAASVVWTKAPKIFGQFISGGTIRPKAGGWLAIPLRGAGGLRAYANVEGSAIRRRPEPRDFRGQKGVHLIDLKDGRLLLVRSTRTRSVPLFLFVRQVRVAKRFDFDGAARKALDALPAAIVARMPA